MQWLCEKERLQDLINEGVSYNEIGKLYNGPNCHSLTENFGSRNTNAPRGKSKYYGKARAD